MVEWGNAYIRVILQSGLARLVPWLWRQSEIGALVVRHPLARPLELQDVPDAAL